MNWREAGHTALVWVAVVCLLAVSLALTLFLLQGREVEITTGNAAEAALAHMSIKVDAVTNQLSATADGLTGLTNKLSTTADAVTGVVKAAQPVVTGLKDTEAKADAAIDLTNHRLNDLCPTSHTADKDLHPCGTLADFNSTLHTATGFMGNGELFLRKVDQHEDTLFTQESQFYTTSYHAAQSLDALAANPDWPLLLHNVNAGVLTGDHMLFTADKVETKLTKCTLNPTFRCVAGSLVVPAAQIGGAAATAWAAYH